MLENVSAYIYAAVHAVMPNKISIREEAAKHQAHQFAVINYNDLLTHPFSLSLTFHSSAITHPPLLFVLLHISVHPHQLRLDGRVESIPPELQLVPDTMVLETCAHVLEDTRIHLLGREGGREEGGRREGGREEGRREGRREGGREGGRREGEGRDYLISFYGNTTTLQYVSMATTLTLYMMVVRGNNIMATFSSIRALFTTFTMTSNWSELMSTPKSSNR